MRVLAADASPNPAAPMVAAASPATAIDSSGTAAPTNGGTMTTGATGATTGTSGVGAGMVAIVGPRSSVAMTGGLITGGTAVVPTVGIPASSIASFFAPNSPFKPHKPNKPRGSSSHHGNPPPSESVTGGVTAGLTATGVVAGAAFGIAATGLAVKTVAVPVDCAIASATASFVSTISMPGGDTDWMAAFASLLDT